MENEYIKRCYESELRYRLHYVCGKDAKAAYPDRLHYDPDLTVAYFKKVTGNIKIEGNSYELKNGDIVILNYNELHCVDIQGEDCERITLYLNESIYGNYDEAVSALLNAFHKRKQGQWNLVPSALAKEHGLDLLIEEILRYCAQQDPVSELVAFGRITELLSELNRTVFAQKEEKRTIHTNNPVIDQVIKYVGLHFAEEITCDKIAESMHLNKYYLGRTFKKTVGITLWNYIINRRLLNFNDLIRQGYAAEEAAYLSGFRNYSNFYRLYKSRVGMAPQEFMKYTFRVKHTAS